MSCMHTSAVTCENCKTDRNKMIGGLCRHSKPNGGCDVCRQEWQDALQTFQPKPVAVSPLKGWQCPVCSAVWAPFHRGCDNCKGSKP